MTNYRFQPIRGTYRSHSYSMTLKYARLFSNGQLINETFLHCEDLQVDGRAISIRTPGFQDLEGGPEKSVRAYIDYLEDQPEASG